MNTDGRRGIGKAALKAVMAATGVKVTSQDAETVARSIARIEAAAATLLQSPSFDETGEYFYRLLNTGAATGAGA
jgi:hypothetical protein